MKLLVNLIQLLIVAAIILPIFSIWDKDKVDKFCQAIEPGISQQRYLELIDEQGVNAQEIIADSQLGGPWQGHVETWLPLGYRCQTEGFSKLVVTAEIIDDSELEQEQESDSQAD